MSKIERYLRRPDTSLARTLRKISPEQGVSYRTGVQKRALEISVVAPATLVAAPLGVVSSVAVFLEDRKNPLYAQKRLGPDMQEFNVVKIRSMKPDADKLYDIYSSEITRHGDKVDPRITKVGKVIRDLNLDELPQLLQILSGEMSLIGMRAAPQSAMDLVASSHPESVERWKNAYSQGSPAMASMTSGFSRERFNDRKRYHYDMFYAKRASLGLDLFILYKHGQSALKFISQKVSSAFSRSS